MPHTGLNCFARLMTFWFWVEHTRLVQRVSKAVATRAIHSVTLLLPSLLLLSQTKHLNYMKANYCLGKAEVQRRLSRRTYLFQNIICNNCLVCMETSLILKRRWYENVVDMETSLICSASCVHGCNRWRQMWAWWLQKIFKYFFKVKIAIQLFLFVFWQTWNH